MVTNFKGIEYGAIEPTADKLETFKKNQRINFYKQERRDNMLEKKKIDNKIFL